MAQQPPNNLQFYEKQALDFLVEKKIITAKEVAKLSGNLPTIPNLQIAFHKCAIDIADHVKNRAKAYADAVKASLVLGDRFSDDSEVIRYLTLFASRLYEHAQQLQQHQISGRPFFVREGLASTLEEALEMWIRIERREKVPSLLSFDQTGLADGYPDQHPLSFEWKELFDRLPKRPSGEPATSNKGEMKPEAA
jgi:predicted transcriptional regulator